MSQDRSVTKVTSFCWMIGAQFPGRVEIFLFTNIFRQALSLHSILPNGYWGTKLTVYLHALPMYKMCGVLLPQPLYAFMMWQFRMFWLILVGLKTCHWKYYKTEKYFRQKT